MGWTPRWSRSLRALLRRRAAEREMDEEMAFHLEQEVQRNLRAGMEPAEARRSALLAFGGVEKFKEEVRDGRPLGWLTGLGLDFRLGARMLRKHPGLTLVGGLSMAFAIAVGAGVFEIATRLAAPRLPLDEGGRVVGIQRWDAAAGRPDPRGEADFAAWREQVRTVSHLGAFRIATRNLVAADGRAEPVRVAEMTASGFRVARVPPLRGRHLTDQDELPGAPPVVVIGEDAWRARFGADPDIVGRRVRLGRTEATVVGVMPAGFGFPLAESVWVPLARDALASPPAEGPPLRIFGRLAPGVTRGQAQAELAALGRRAAADAPGTHRHLRPQVVPYALSVLAVRWDVLRNAALGVNASTLLFVLLVCANVATLVFARAATRESEIAVRTALGAGRARIVAQLFAEALVLGGVAALVGLGAAAAGLRWCVALFESRMGALPFWMEGGLSPRTVAYAAGLTVLGAAVAGVLPALKVTGRALDARLRQGVVGGASVRFGRLWTGIVVTQVALTVAFVPAVLEAALDARALQPSAGFDAERYLSVRVETDPAGAAPAPSGSAGALAARLQEEPDVEAVVLASELPGTFHPRRVLEVEGLPATAPDPELRKAQVARVAPGFFEGFGAPIVAGRGFQPGDLETELPVVVVNEAFVRAVLEGRNAIGQRVRYVSPEGAAGEAGPWHEIVGVVRQVPMTPDPELHHAGGLYHPADPADLAPLYLAARVRGQPEALAPRLRELALEVDPGLRLHDLRPLDDALREEVATLASWVALSLLAGVVVLLLSTTGIYAVLSFTVARRTREIGIRVALGAGRARIVSGVLARAFGQVGLGVALGAVLLVGIAGGVESAGQAAKLGGYVALMAAVCLLACALPTRRALRVQPTEAMRADL